MSTTEYTDIKIIDCNRQHSIQARSGNYTNPALFTNELGRGLKLNVGDKVSVKSSFISEIGAGSDTIEFKGEATGKQRSITYTKETPNYYTTLNDRYADDTRPTPLITGFQEYTIDNEATITYDIKDNETYITNQYYINLSGDSGYVSLPRRFVVKASYTMNASMWTTIDSNASDGRPFHEQIASGYVSDDYIAYDTSISASSTSGYYKLRSDCSRYTLMKRAGTLKLRRETIDHLNGSNIDNGYPPTAPLIFGDRFYTYKEPLKISVQNGFNSPDSIGNDIDNQLKKTEDPKPFIVENAGIARNISITTESATYKPQLCSTDVSMSEESYDAFYGSRSASTTEKDGAWEYWSSYYNIYVKRPEIREQGQGFNNYAGSGLKTYGTVIIADKATSTIKTTIKFEETKLLQLRALFQAQKLYPELFSNKNAQALQPVHNGKRMSVENARFIHMNTQESGTRNTFLGGDNMEVSASLTNNQSLPLFFYFDKSREDIGSDGSDTTELAYGFASRYTNGSFDYIELHPELIGGINPRLFDSVSIDDATMLGYDHHFNAYGNATVMGYNGRLRRDLPDINEWGVGSSNLLNGSETLSSSGFLRQQYIGADNPLFKYDPVNNRFYFSQLHTAETIGQEWVGAGDSASGVSPAIPDNTQNADNVVYKLNKRIDPYTFTPDMKPYVYEYDPDIKYNYGNASDIAREISRPNRNISPWSIFDSQTGIYISDFGYGEDDWDTGLWGILGFAYEQFNNTETQHNRLTRITNINSNNLNLATTNADVVPSDLSSYIVNQFGAGYFTNQIPTSSFLASTNASHKNPTFLPAITQNTTSIKINASNLPRKMLRPYYCIRSDIIDAPHYIGGHESNTLLPVVSVCDKQYSGGDFYFSSDEDFQFTITKEKTITNITTSIHDPDQTFSKVNGDSAVIYKIQSQVVNQLDLAQQLLDSLKKS